MINAGDSVNVFDRETHTEGLRDNPEAIRGLLAELGAQGILSVELHFIQAAEPGFEGAERLLQAFLEVSANRHGFTDRFHSGGQDRIGANEFLKREARNFSNDIINGRLE